MTNRYVRKICWTAFSIVLLSWFVQPISSQIDSLDAQRTVVAKVHVHRLDGADAYAAAIYMGSSPQTSYFITANHAVRKGITPIFATVDIRFLSSPDPVSATVFDSFKASEDLAILSVPVVSLPKNLPRLTVTEVKSDTQIHIVGQPSAGDWSVWAGILQNENATSGDINHFTTSTDQSLAGGFSGGPVFDSPGYFLGMHTETTNTYGVALKATDILRQLSAWNVPHENLVIVKASGPAPIVETANTFPVYMVARHLWIDNKKLGEITSGTITISIDDVLNYPMNIHDHFDDQRTDLTAGQHEVRFAVDVHVRDYNRSFRVKQNCIQPFQINGTATLEPHIKFDDRGSVISCGLSPLKK